ncbi:hydantoinase/oxoprolinase family protein [Rhodoplanes sp. TEM]|uniref:Hydantoinase/oxoprolinase family protein n=1 Tax=Rhodoplanes tepidamans TaxID=200616 RepID=A0ABT5JFB8_RHOTP|nr:MULTISPECIES: hydantoinase/oxoprolinase family protein [Rhodoplanes]MDC7788394.1 hydantoinase/oxoprolinase family protein [Rhodoplanes tepidamans]MDC7985325.1 hydantoinase/oxoprolinase family protein [Rhodoplanes sp. TEM]MDQ0357107.1 N-methylhydantoinase A [Rhodoplanes tepidamans]
MSERTTRIGVDVGGTFTDLVLHDPARDLVHTGKLLTTPDDPSLAIIAGIQRMLAETGLAPGDLHSIVNGTTLVTNTVIERTGATIGLLTTEGFRDVIEIGRETRYDLYDLFLEAPPTLVPRRRRREIRERLDVDGAVLVPLDEAAVATTARALVEEHGVEAIAISFLHAYRNAAHEERAAAIVRALYPDLPLTLSSQVAPEIREFERTSTACANAYVQPLMRRYVDRLEARLAAIGFTGRLYVMLSGGGIAAVSEAREFPIRLIESGPAAGAMAASFIARHAGLDRVVSFDMGGTTAKMCLVEDGAPDHKFDFEAGRVRRFVKGSGLPLKVSVVDMIEIGAGGGSIARADTTAGLMKVGPRSAGSKPGPVCYGLGGQEPTVTDADLVLGRLDPSYFLGGEMALDVDAVRRAFDAGVAGTLGLGDSEAALGVQRIVDETMASATRIHLAEKGRDPRRYTLIAFGGAGPVHAFNLARLLKMERLVVPLGAGVASALGFLVAPPATDMVRSYVARLERVDWAHVNALFAAMTEQGTRLLRDAGADPATVTLRPTAEMRHFGQGFEVPVALPSTTLGPDDVPAIRDAFFAAYRERFGRAMEDAPIECLSWRLACAAPGRDIRMDKGAASRAAATRDGTDAAAARRGVRDVLFEGLGPQACAVYDRYALRPGATFAGPALVEERESTCCIGPGSTVRVDDFLNLVIELA